MDVPGWHSSSGEAYDCAWYAASDVPVRCESLGSAYENDGHTANTACCVCGGGTRGFKSSPSSAPSSVPTQSPSKLPTQQPSVSVSQHPSVSIQPTTLYQVALVVLYDATNGDEWDDSTNWLSDAPLCEWYGIDCNNDDDVVRIDLYGNNLQGSIPSELGLLINLRLLFLTDNLLTGTLPDEVCALRDDNGGSLEFLYADCEVMCPCCTG